MSLLKQTWAALEVWVDATYLEQWRTRLKDVLCSQIYQICLHEQKSWLRFCNRPPVALEYVPGLQAKQAEAPVSFQLKVLMYLSQICDYLNIKYIRIWSETENLWLKVHVI